MNMDLTPGTFVGPYEITGLLGAGGMGQVYRARDAKLERDVAIKVLPAHSLDDADRRRRFDQEARTLASLNHPNIAAIYGLEESDGRRALVLELVDGLTLADRLASGPLPIDEALAAATQIADALDAAHEGGIVHRDLKPANIKLSRDGRLKVLDFGLAKVAKDDETAADLTQLPTITYGATRQGVLLGTAAYMSPEQARGLVVDKRTDVWAFGCVLYEMLTGRGAFARATIPDTLAAIVEGEPQWNALPARTPPLVRRILERCLEKDAKLRIRDIGDVRTELAQLAADGQSSRRSRAAAGRASRMPTVAAMLAGVALLVGAVVWSLFSNRTSTPPLPPRMEPITAFTDFAVQPSLSPDGRMVAFIRGPDDLFTSGQIYIKLLPSGEPVQLTNDNTLKMMPVFSPDGTRIAYTVVKDTFSWDTWTVPVLGGEPRPWLPNASGLQWTDAQHVLFSEIDVGLHMKLVASTEGRTAARNVYVPESIRGMVHRSYLSPDRKNVLMAEMDKGGMIACRLVPYDGSTRGVVAGPATGQCTHAAWSPDGRWMYFTTNASGSFQLWRQRFPDGKPEQLTNGPTEVQGLAMASDGKSVVSSVGLVQSSIWIHDNNGDRQISVEGQAMFPAWGDGFPTSVFSPDGTKLYYLVANGPKQGFRSGELWIADLSRGSSERAFPGVTVTSYDISPDGESVLYASADGSGKSRAWIARLDRRTSPEMLPPAEALGPVFGSDGDVFFRGPEGGEWYIYRLELASGQIRKFTPDAAVNSPIISPDRRWIVSWVPDARKNTTTVVKAFPVSGGAPLTVCSGCYLKWPRDQQTLFVSFVGNSQDGSSTYVLRVPPGRALPDLPEGGFSENDLKAMRPMAVVKRAPAWPGTTASVYAFEQGIVQSNLHRIPLPE
jgi:serine/threonine protein kinase/WD40 repeat protein